LNFELKKKELKEVLSFKFLVKKHKKELDRRNRDSEIILDLKTYNLKLKIQNFLSVWDWNGCRACAKKVLKGKFLSFEQIIPLDYSIKLAYLVKHERQT